MGTVYIGMSGDFIHHGHINVLKTARGLGEVTVGLLTDYAISSRKRLPLLSFNQRREIVSNLAGVATVVPQEEWDYSVNVKRYQPDFFVHGDDWTKGPELRVRERVIAALEVYGGKLVEVPYTEGVSSGALSAAAMAVGTTPEVRRASLRRSLEAKPLSRFIEAHSPLSALIAEHARANRGDMEARFDGFWSSSLTDSTVLGKPDNEMVSVGSRLAKINEIFEVSSRPLIFDADTGGKPEHLELNVRSMERLGISALIIEDKTGLKKNSLLGNSVAQTQESIADFSYKIEAAAKAKDSHDFMVIARIESLILEAGMDDALARGDSYVAAGADAVMIHSRSSQPDEVFAFAREFRGRGHTVPLVCVPTTYNNVREEELEDAGFNIVIYANHLLRASYPAMLAVAQSILAEARSSEVDEDLISIEQILSLVPGTR